MPEQVLDAALAALSFLGGIVAHQYATAMVADRLGDKVSRMRGRLTLSPKAHVDVLGTIVLPAIFVLAVLFRAGLPAPPFGYGKRHDLNPLALRNPKHAPLVALAGPAATALLAVLAFLGMRAMGCGALGDALFTSVHILVAMTVIELLPVPGRDGGRILAYFLKPGARTKFQELEEYDAVFVILLLIFLGSLVGRIVSWAGGPLLSVGCV